VEPRPPLERVSDGALVAGVCAGLARHLGVEPVVVRLAFGALTIMGGAGLLAYAAFWAFVPAAEGQQSDGRSREQLQLPAIAAVALGGLLLLRQASFFPNDAVIWPVVVAGAGVVLVWRQADDAQRQWWGPGGGRRGLVRVLAGVALLATGMTALVAANDGLQATTDALVAITVVVAGLVLTFAPWARRLFSDLGAERRARIRSEERAEVAAHLHDSVLQTLALIQRRADAPDEVQRLARGQERELRRWLYGRTATVAGGLVAEIERVAADVESTHGVAVEVVTVGDIALDDHVDALVRAAREAMVNAAKFSGANMIDVFAEVDGRSAVVFVRDTGKGFELAAVPADRHGVSESIIGRMERHGGQAVVRSHDGEGTEIELRLELAVDR
jgi:signal transduction histidine kinase